MNIHDATEVAFKNGYEAGVKEFAEKFKSIIKDSWLMSAPNVEEKIDKITKELTESKNDLEG